MCKGAEQFALFSLGASIAGPQSSDKLLESRGIC